MVVILYICIKVNPLNNIVIHIGLCVKEHNSSPTLSYLDEWFSGLAWSAGRGRLAALGPSCHPQTRWARVGLPCHNKTQWQLWLWMPEQYMRNIIFPIIFKIQRLMKHTDGFKASAKKTKNLQVFLSNFWICVRSDTFRTKSKDWWSYFWVFTLNITNNVQKDLRSNSHKCGWSKKFSPKT